MNPERRCLSGNARHCSRIRSIFWGYAWPNDVPALCGKRPQSGWRLSVEHATCPDRAARHAVLVQSG
jgi:hypothetical protein